MSQTVISVIIPVFNQSEFLGDAVQSVLDQTYPDFEIIVVNDGSSDGTRDNVQQFSDVRIQYIEHAENRGLPAARNTGIWASSGELLALLDADDSFHPEKLKTHVDFLGEHPEVGVSYNSRFELNHSSSTIRELWCPPPTVSLSDLVLGFPFAPSDMVLRRDWVVNVNLFDESYVDYSEDLDINCRLALAGCQFANVGRALNYRRYHSRRIIKNINSRLEAALRALNKAFNDPRCPNDVLAMREIAYANNFMVWGFIAFAQDETMLGQKYFLEATRLNPSVLDGEPCELMKFLLNHSIADKSVNHEGLLRTVIAQLPDGMSWLSHQLSWAIPRGYLLKGARAFLWECIEDGRNYFALAEDSGAEIDESFLGYLTHQLMNYEAEFGITAARDRLKHLIPDLRNVGGAKSVHHLDGLWSFNRAFSYYHSGEYSRVSAEVIRALVSNPTYLTNRGVFAILIRSVARRISNRWACLTLRDPRVSAH